MRRRTWSFPRVAEHSGFARRLPHGQGRARRGRQGRELRHPREHHRGAGGRVGLGQERHRDVGAEPAARQRRAPRPRAVAGARPAAGHAARTAEDARQGDRLRLPGPDELAQPGLHHRPAAVRAADEAPGPVEPTSLGARRDAAGRGGHPRTEAAPAGLPARVVGRPAAARDDRHGAGLRAQAADRRRADDGARRHHPAPDPRTAGQAEDQPPHERAVHQPRPRPGGRDRRPRGGDAPRRGARAGPRQADLTATPRRCWPAGPAWKATRRG